MKTPCLLATSVAAALACAAAPVSIRWSPTGAGVLSLDRAEARIGRPLTPGSVAGVNRRVERRTYRRAAYRVGTGAAITGAAVAGAAYTTGAPYNYGSNFGYGSGDYGGYGTEYPGASGSASYGAYGAAMSAPPQSPVMAVGQPFIVNPSTGRWCRVETGGNIWCWTP
jgi:hypothetical protein